MLLGEILIEKKLIRKDQLLIALDEQKKTQEFLGMILVRKKFIAEEDLMKALETSGVGEEMVAASKMRKAQTTAIESRPY